MFLNMVLIICCIAFVLKHIIFDNAYIIIDKTIFGIAGIAFLGKILLRLLPGGVYKELNGFMEGFLIVDSQKITIYENEYLFKDIKSIEVSARDYSGFYIRNSRYEFGAYSNGVDNYLKLHTNDGKIIRAEFQQINPGTFKDTVETIVPETEIYKFTFIEGY